MPDQEITVSVDVDHEEALAAIREVTEAVDELREALERLGGTDIGVTVGSHQLQGVHIDSSTTDGPLHEEWDLVVGGGDGGDPYR